MAKTEEWKKQLAQFTWKTYTGPAPKRLVLEAEHAEVKVVLTELGLAKGQ